jgi:hypothetical protein
MVRKGIKWAAGKVAGAARRGAAAVRRFLFPNLSFQAGKESHRLFFDGDGADAPVMVASDTRRLKTFVKNFRVRKDKKPGTNEALDGVEEQLAVIDAQRPLLETDPDKANRNINKALGVISRLLAPILAEGDTGTVASPYKVDWPKRPLAAYDPLYIGPKVGEYGVRISQSELAAAAGSSRGGAMKRVKDLLWPGRKPTKAYAEWEKRGFAIEAFKPYEKRALPEGGETIGVEPMWQTHTGMKFELHPGSKTGGGGKVNRSLRPYGYSAGDEGRDGDHVLERQVGGPDVMENLWPLELSENRTSGGTLASSALEVPGSNASLPMETAKKQAKTRSVWLVIRSMK